MFELTDKVSIVTGGTSGLGKATALALASQGAKVVVSGRREAEGEAVVAKIKSSGGEALFLKADVSREDDVRQLFETTKTHYGKVDIAFLNSGVFAFSPLKDQTSEELARQLDINVKGVYYGIKYAAQHLGQGGSIIVNSSGVAVKGLANATAYSSTKGAVNAIVRSASVELAGAGIRVNAVAPGPIWTEGAEVLMGSRENFEGAMATMVPLGRVGEAHEIAWPVVFLASSAASFITGHILAIDGGLTAA
jgi:NAD(P)-dependent dehydrogenase (short-subunit alcohol dehydrogenase family)